MTMTNLNSSRYQRSSLGDAQLIALNFTDLLISCFSLANLISFNEYERRTKDNFQHQGDIPKTAIEEHYSFIRYYFTLVNFLIYLALFSCFTTVMLSVTRTLALVKPLYVIRKKIVYIAFGICSLLLLIPIVIKCTVLNALINYAGSDIFACDDRIKQLHHISTATGIAELGTILIIVTIVGMSTAMSVKTLRTNTISTRQAANNENSRKATIMILTLSIIFVISNGAWGLIWAIITALYPESCSDEATSTMTATIAQVLNYFWIALNSTANPIVYMTRNSALNDYTKTHLTRLRRFPIIVIHKICRIVQC